MPTIDHPNLFIDPDFDVAAAGEGVPKKKDLDRLEVKLSIKLPEDYRWFQLQYGAAAMFARDNIWPDGELGDVGPSWTFNKGFLIIGLGEGAPEYLDIRAVTKEFHKEWHEALPGTLVPFFRYVNDADFFCFDKKGRIVSWSHEVPHLAKPVGLSFDEFLWREIRALVARKNAIKTAGSRYKRAWRDKAVYPLHRAEPPTPKELRARWTAGLVKKVMPLLKKKGRADRKALRELVGTVEGTDLIDCRGFQPSANLFECRFEDIDFSHADFSKHRMRASKASGCRFHQTKFRATVGADCANCEFDGADLRSVADNSSKYIDCRFADVNLGGAELLSCKFENCTFSKVNFKRAELSLCTFTGCTFQECDFVHTRVGKCRFINPTQNLRWTDADTKKEATHVVSAKADWFAITGAKFVSISVKTK
ncbi:MAG: pentapeptide repeat-containing protein [Myxococcales bacterium]|nr:pentapeptide repeat-containing protein [Myxococcales bacterium]